MTTLNTKFIHGLDQALEKLFAPVLAEGQSITCYVGEEMTPYVIQGDNILSSQTATSTSSDHTIEFHSITAEDISSKGFELAHNIADGQQSNVSISLNGIPLAYGVDFSVYGVDFSVSGNSIVWNALLLDAFGLQVGDILIVSYILT